ncbi:prolipoprotein diacylglyceryl transferase [Lyticum sinuosum]|uniref:Phosphatidylglycerol--prolipoprotein diacylglyceryl transferase n=1 Tax=Lyticum sinuosum TaxID=1332059 RepID=A0AAE4VKJ0_9RICK|nr:prolipoprotein diacylglyceryl transferase [Lyticum sinuosum]MDZ5761048.1 Prolipoprotein diacylglyceryl transferase [Lyticum sinuosum]
MNFFFIIETDKKFFSIYGINFYWYGMSYAIGFLISMFIIRILNEKSSYVEITDKSLDSLFFFLIMGVVLGGRIGYVLFYNPLHYLHNFNEIYKTWEGGMSFHGGLIGTALALKLFCAKQKIQFSKISDLVCVSVPISLFFGRIANFTNGELYGKPTNLPWAVIFKSIDNIPRHPSQLYEAITEGLILFIIMIYLWNKKRKIWKSGTFSGCFLIFYSIMRIICEIFRVPDYQIGYIKKYFTQGQILSIIMILFGFYFIYICNKKQNYI